MPDQQLAELAAALAHTGDDIGRALTEQAKVARELADEKHSTRQQFRLLMVLVAFASVLITAILLLGGRNVETEANERSQLSRDRQQCATALQVNWSAKVGDVLKKATEIPRTPRTGEEYQAAVRAMDEATALLHQASALCYGPIPNPYPVP